MVCCSTLYNDGIFFSLTLCNCFFTIKKTKTVFCFMAIITKAVILWLLSWVFIHKDVWYMFLSSVSRKTSFGPHSCVSPCVVSGGLGLRMPCQEAWSDAANNLQMWGCISVWQAVMSLPTLPPSSITNHLLHNTSSGVATPLHFIWLFTKVQYIYFKHVKQHKILLISL